MNMNNPREADGGAGDGENELSPVDPTPGAIRILLATDTRLYREGLVMILSRFPDVLIAGWADEAASVVARIRESSAEVVLLDMAMPDSHAIARGIAASTPDVRVVALAVPCNERTVLDCAESGVTGYVLREASADDLVTALRSAGSGELRCPPSVAAILRRRLTSPVDVPVAIPTSRLTSRERQILGLVEEGLANKAIAQALGIEVATVKNHVHNILEKLSVHRRGQAAASARSHLDPSLNPRLNPPGSKM